MRRHGKREGELAAGLEVEAELAETSCRAGQEHDGPDLQGLHLDVSDRSIHNRDNDEGIKMPFALRRLRGDTADPIQLSSLPAAQRSHKAGG
jgi:hypothetical protein